MCDTEEKVLNENMPELVLIKEEVIIEEDLEFEDVMIKQEFQEDDGKPHKCNQCPSAFKTLNFLTQHEVLVHGREGKFACEICGKMFMGLSELKRHLIKHSDERNFKCDQCDKAFKRKAILSDHKMIVHATERPFQCEVCPKTFVSAKFLTNHFKDVHNDKPHKCDQCPKAFRALHHLTQHKVNVHENEGKLACELCAKTFLNRSSLKLHSIKHSNEKNFKCDQCEMTFKRKEFVAGHKRNVHATERPFQCEMCSKTFAIAACLKTHTKRAHSDSHEAVVKLHKCDQCCSVFKSHYFLVKHNSQAHGRESKFACGMCDKKFVLSSELKQHLFTHNNSKDFKCPDCGKMYKTKTILDRHVKFVHANEKPYQCDECHKCFGWAWHLQQHSLTHNEEPSFKCNLCPQKLKYKAGLVKHVKVMHKQKVKTFEDVEAIGAGTFSNVKGEQVMEFDSEPKRVVLDIQHEITDKMDVYVKQEPGTH